MAPSAMPIAVLFLLLCGIVGASKSESQTSTIYESSSSLSNGQVNVSHHNNNATDEHHEEVRYHVVDVNFEKIASVYGITLWIFFASIAKMGFHAYEKLSTIFPESCLLIVLGVLVGVVIFFGFGETETYRLTPDTFFYYLLPPIILEAGYFMPNRAFFGNIGTILLFAVVGTLFNTFSIGLSIYGVSQAELLDVPEHPTDIPLLHCLVFSSLISAVDPVAVLAVFEEIHVNEVLHIVVFGESLLNDAVTVVLYHMFERYSLIGENVNTYDVLAGMLSFVLTGVVGTLIGVMFGLMAGFITKYTSHVRVIEPIFVFVLAYLSYLTAEIFHFSGIMALTFCGIVMKRYVESNISEKSHTTIKYFMKMLSSISETIIFMFLGTSTVVSDHKLNWKLVLFTLLFCLAYRAIGVLVLSYFANKKRLAKLSMVDQFVMAYGGLRGAIAFCLALVIDEEHIPARGLFITTTIIVVFFTVFIQGISIKPLVNVLRVKKKVHYQLTMNEQIHERMVDHLMAGVEDITGFHGNHFLRDKFEHFDNMYLKKYLLKKEVHQKERGIFRVHTKLAMKEAMEGISRTGSSNLQVSEPSLLRLIRNYSSGSLHNSTQFDRLSPAGGGGAVRDENGDLIDTNGEETVIDLQALNAHYSKKMADDSKIHHILTDNMIQTRRRWSKPTKNDIPDSVDYTPYHHKERTHLRKIISHQQRKAAKKAAARDEQRARHLDAANQGLSGMDSLDISQAQKNVSFAGIADDTDSSWSSSKVNVFELLYYNDLPRVMTEGGPHINMAVDEHGLQSCSIRELEEDDTDGISFAVNNFFIPDEDDDDMDESRRELVEPTAAEITLPWKRNASTVERPALTSHCHSMGLGGCPDAPVEPIEEAPPQLAEHPSWTNNPDYTPDVANDRRADQLQSSPPASPPSYYGDGRRVSFSVAPPTLVENPDYGAVSTFPGAENNIVSPPPISFDMPPSVPGPSALRGRRPSMETDTLLGRGISGDTLTESSAGSSTSDSPTILEMDDNPSDGDRGMFGRHRSSLERVNQQHAGEIVTSSSTEELVKK